MTWQSQPSGDLPDDGLASRRREQILAAATGAFATHGYPSMDVGGLAEQLGIGKGTIYRYFPKKSELFLAAVDRAMRLMREAVNAASAGEPDGLRRIELAVQAYLDFFDRHPEFVELLIQERAEFRDRKRPTYFEHRDRNVQQWTSLYQGLMAEGRVRTMPVDQITDVVSHLLYGTMFTNFFVGHTKSSREQAREILDVVFHGILTNGCASSADSKPPGKSSRKASS